MFVENEPTNQFKVTVGIHNLRNDAGGQVQLMISHEFLAYKDNLLRQEKWILVVKGTQTLFWIFCIILVDFFVNWQICNSSFSFLPIFTIWQVWLKLLLDHFLFMLNNGYHRLNSNKILQEIHGNEVFMYPDYVNGEPFNHDIALLKLSSDIKFTDDIQPICISGWPFQKVKILQGQWFSEVP